MLVDLLESLNEIHPIRRVEPKLKLVNYDEWEFDVGNETHVLRFSRLSATEFGKRVSRIEFGIRRGKHIRKKMDKIANIRKYIATVTSIVQKAIEEPTKELQKKSDGMCVVIQSDVFGEIGATLKRIFSMRFRSILRMHDKYFDFPEDDSNAIYFWRKNKTFNSSFTGIDVEESFDATTDNKTQEPIMAIKKTEPIINIDKKKSEIKKIMRDMVDTKIKASPVVQTTNPVIQQQLSKKDVGENIEEKLNKVKKLGNDLTKAPFNETGFLRVVVATNLFANSLPKSQLSDNSSLSGKTITDISESDISAYLSAKYTKKYPNILSPFEYMVALNISGIKTGEYGDLFDSDAYFKKQLFDKFAKVGIDKSTIKAALPEKYRENVTFDEVITVCKNAKQILESNGIIITDRSKSSYFNEPIDAEKSTSGIAYISNMDKKQKTKLLYDILASISQSDIDNHKPYKYEPSSNKTKIVKEKNYSSDSPIIYDFIRMRDLIENIAETPEEYVEFINLLPSFAQGMYTEDVEIFEVEYITSWTLAGGSFAQYVAHKALSDVGVNAQLNDFWNSQSESEDKKNKAVVILEDRFKSHFTTLYERNQEFFKQKFKKKYEDTTIKLYRGVGISTVDTYVPGALESWTTQVSTAKRFGEMMTSKGNTYTILYAEVPIQHIFGSFESFADTFPGEEDLKGKKEYIVMGGTFATTPIYTFDTDKKVTKNKVTPFKEWVMTEGFGMIKKAIKVMTPSMKGFSKVIKSSNTAKGNDPKENDARKSENEVDND